ncbi:MAG TPA: hypothetical protein VKV32_02130 [Stellaceae bacterium]|nr:hypothetical protein [Stellaceae bacterium]
MNTKRGLLAVAVAAALSMGAPPLLTSPARAADVSVNFDAGNVAFGFTDGYWDRDHHWHRWPNASARNDWRAHNKAHYYSHAHTHYKSAGWRDQDHYWEHH